MKVGIVSNDAGGANILLNYTKNNKYQYSYFLKGPSNRIFRKKQKKKIINNYNLKEIKGCDFVITGTSERSNHEIEAIKFCKKNKIKVVSFLDHWVNYKNRFKRNGNHFLPNEIWTGDKYSFELAKKIFVKDNIKIRLKINPYLSNLKVNFKNKKKFLLYVSSSYQKKGIDELDIFKKLLDILPKLSLKSKKIIFKLHPSEFLSKYKNASKKFSNSYKVKIIKDDDLEYYVKSSEAVFGCNSMALVVASKLNIKSYNCTIHNKIVSNLPFKKIKILNVK